jgi:hypothetical protein
MTGRQILGAILIAVPIVGIVTAATWAMSQQHGWRVAAGIWLVACTMTAAIYFGAVLLAGEAS